MSGRNFTDKGINEIAKGMISKVKHTSFKFKLGFMRYFSPALKNESRTEELVNRDDFDGAFNYSEELKQQNRQEKYLSELEYSLDTSPEMHLKKKLAATLARSKAYHLLTSISQMFLEDDKFVFSLNQPVALKDGEKQIILDQVKAVYSYFNKSLSFVGASSVEFRVKKQINTKGMFEEQLPDNVWGKMREYLQKITWRGSNGSDLDRNWFNSFIVEALIQEKNKTIALKASTTFIRDWIEREYECLLEMLAKNFGYEYVGIEVER